MSCVCVCACVLVVGMLLAGASWDFVLNKLCLLYATRRQQGKCA